MNFREDDRGAAVQIGVVILLAFVVLAIAAYQAQVVPAQNAEVEYNHNQQVRGEMQDLRNGVVSVPGGGEGTSVSVTLGTSYPERTIFRNPPRPTGELRTGPPGTVVVENARATGEVGDFWNGTNRTYTTRGLAYRPTYYEYQSGPVSVYENTVVYDVQDDKTLLQSEQRVVDGRRITLGTLNGTYQESSSETVSVDLRDVSTSDNVVTVRNASDDPITITLPTRLSEDDWRELLEEEFVSEGGHVKSVSSTDVPSEPFNLVHIRLEAGVEYSLQMAKVGVGSGVTEPESTYLTEVEGDGETVTTGTNVTLVAEVRDRFNNPVAGELVNASVVSGPGTVSPANATSDADGRVAFDYRATSAGTATVQAWFGTDPNGSDRRHVNFTVNVQPAAGGSYSIAWDSPRQTDDNGAMVGTCNGNQCTWDAGADSDGVLDLRAATAPSTSGVSANFNLDDTSVASVTPSTNTTNGAGEVWTTLTPKANGTVNVTVRSGTSVDVIQITVQNVPPGNSPPTASFSTNESTVLTLEDIEFNASGSSDPDGDSLNYSWTFDDGTSDSGQVVVHDYADDGTYTVTLTVDDGSATDSTTKTITVNNRDPTARFDYSPSNPATGETVTFDASNSGDRDGVIVSYDWEFGDGTTATGEVVSHSYASPGNYTVELTVTDNDTAKDTTTEVVSVGSSDTGPPSVTDASITNAPINYSDAGNTQVVTVTFNESMDQSVDPTVKITDLPESNDVTVSGTYVDGTTWEGTVDLPRNSDESNATIHVEGAEDDAGNLQTPNPDTSNQFYVDTKRPQDPDEARILTSPINISNQNDVTAEVDLPSPRESGTVYLRLTGPDGNTVVVSQAVDTGSYTQVFQNIDVSSLSDGVDAIKPEARVVDDYGNENPSGYTASANNRTKDTVAPAISNFTLTNPSGTDLEVEFASDEALADILVEITDGDGNTVARLTRADFNEDVSGGEYTYTATTTTGSTGQFTATLLEAKDAVGNEGASGQSDTAWIVVRTYVSEFDDDECGTCGGPDEPNENSSLTPDNAEGNVNDFADYQVADDNFGWLDEVNYGGPGVGNSEWNVSVGVATYGIPSGTNQTVEIRYRTNMNTERGPDPNNEDYVVTVVYPNGTPITGNTYTLPATDGSIETASFRLSPEERAYVNRTGNLYLVFEDADPDDGRATLYDIFHVRVATSDD
ncbi:hypothetical protein BRD00_14115 [Halobacteriales archaeon QS_8_69_26]|nr:MAG: hypothetical protein BRD00_14115 [Halobacteriales archaeon QS_8_69_26]